MNLLQRLMHCFSIRGKATTLYKRGMAKAKSHDHLGAIKDYSTIIGAAGTPTDMLAMVLYNRALVYVAAGDEQHGAVDLEKVLGMKEGLQNVKSMARQKLARMQARSGKADK